MKYRPVENSKCYTYIVSIANHLPEEKVLINQGPEVGWSDKKFCIMLKNHRIQNRKDVFLIETLVQQMFRATFEIAFAKAVITFVLNFIGLCIVVFFVCVSNNTWREKRFAQDVQVYKYLYTYKYLEIPIYLYLYTYKHLEREKVCTRCPRLPSPLSTTSTGVPLRRLSFKSYVFLDNFFICIPSSFVEVFVCNMIIYLHLCS